MTLAFFGILDPDAYEGFVDENWSLEDLVAHFKRQMEARRLLLWGTGAEDIWRVRVSSISSLTQGFRQMLGAIDASRGRLCLTNYESLTMAAAYKDVKLPEKHHQDLLIEVPAGSYQCRITQLADPECNPPPSSEADFILEVQPRLKPVEAWTAIPWTDLERDLE